MIFANLASFVGNIVFNHGTRLFKRGMTSGNDVRKYFREKISSKIFKLSAKDANFAKPFGA